MQDAPTDDDPWLTKAQVADLAKVRVRTIERHISAGRLKAVRSRGLGGVRKGDKKSHSVWIKTSWAVAWMDEATGPAAEISRS